MSNSIRKVSRDEFPQAVAAGSKPVLVDFYADWCGPCKAVQPVLESIAAEDGDTVDIVKVDVDQEQALAAQFGIRSIPTLMLFKDGAPVDSILGVTTRDTLLSVISKHANLH